MIDYASLSYITFYRIAVTISTVLDQSVTNSRWQLGEILKTSSNDFCLKTCTNIFTYFCNIHRMYLYYPVIFCVLPTT